MTTSASASATSGGTATELPTTGSAAADSSASGGDDATTGGSTGEDVAPPIPGGFVKRWPPPGVPPCGDSHPTALRVHAGYLVVGTSCGELFRSPDGGQSWQARPTPGTPKQPLMMGVTADFSDLVVAGGRLFASYRGGTGVFATDDVGDTWIAFTSGLSGPYGKVVLDMHVVGDTLYTASFGAGVHASPIDVAGFVALNSETDDAQAQSPSSTCPNTPGYLDPISMQPMTFLHGFALADDGEFLYYGNKCGGIYRSALADLPGKAAWEGFGAGLPFFDAYYQDPFAIASDGAVIYAGIDDEGAYSTLARQPAAWGFISQQGLIYDKLDPIAWLLVDGAVYMGCSFGGVYVSTTQGSPWTDLNQLPGGKIGDGADTIYDLAHDGEHIYVAASSGLYVSVP